METTFFARRCLWRCVVSECFCSLSSHAGLSVSQGLKFITNCSPLTHQCVLYSKVNWTSSCIRSLSHWYEVISKTILVIVPSYFSCLLTRKHGSHDIRSTDVLHFIIHRIKTELGEKAFWVLATSAGSKLQSELNFKTLFWWKSSGEIIKVNLVCVQVF